jgi:glucose dehydrogenase
MKHRLTRRLLPAIGIVAVLALSPVVAQRAVSSNDWPGYNRTFTGDRFSPLSVITTDNVARLRHLRD